MFRVAEPLITSKNAGTAKTVYALNHGVKLSDVNGSITKSATLSRTKRQRSGSRARRHTKY